MALRDPKDVARTTVDLVLDDAMCGHCDGTGITVLPKTYDFIESFIRDDRTAVIAEAKQVVESWGVTDAVLSSLGLDAVLDDLDAILSEKG